LAASGETIVMRADHAAYFLSLAERAEQAEGGDQLAWFARLEQEHANLRAALEHGPLELIARLSAALADFWALRDHQQEGERWLDWVLHCMIEVVQRVADVALAKGQHERAAQLRAAVLVVCSAPGTTVLHGDLFPDSQPNADAPRVEATS
jgi:hypothetical protein